MNGAVKFHKATGPAFYAGEEWHGSGSRCWIVDVQKYPRATGSHMSDYEVTYRYADGSISRKDAWNFQVRYNHIADHYVKISNRAPHLGKI